ncbi:MAG TPA: VOC family protein [Ruminiclostridium sp.]|jgi:catechol 2,3-dioxygenase-like lactoylglutathione lyase family enzyme|nr:VOC family protein [Ruminiclostridium sp.]
MKYASTLLAVSNIDKSKKWYADVLGLKVVADFGANATLTGGVVLQTLDTWKEFIRTDIVLLPNNSCEIYFEEENMDAFWNHLKSFDICYLHKLFEHRWGQRVVRFYDPDRHIIEVGEQLDAVIKRFISQGMSVEEVAIRMDIPVDFVNSCLKNN